MYYAFWMLVSFSPSRYYMSHHCNSGDDIDGL